MTQRDRLAAIMHDLVVFECWPSQNECEGHAAEAQELLARGVRVVDGLTLARAVHETVGSPMDDLTTFDMTSCRDVADRIVAALDAEA